MARRSKKKSTPQTKVKPAVIPATKPSNTSINNSKSMLEKTEVKTYDSEFEDRSVIGKMIAFAFIIFGLIIIISVAILLIVTRISPRVDKSIEKPTISQLSSSTNKATVSIEGEAPGVNKVMLFVNDKAQGSLADVEKDGTYSYEYEFDEEGDYKFETAGVKGSIIRSRGEKSDSVSTKYDTTPPSGEVELNYDQEVTGETISISGKADPDSEVVLKRGDKTYVGEVDGEGNFVVSDVPLDSGDNDFTVEVRDDAGNVTITSESVSVTKADLNGPGATDSTNLPQSAGELDEALSQIFQNSFMMIIAVIAMVVFVVNSGLVVAKLGLRK